MNTPKILSLLAIAGFLGSSCMPLAAFDDVYKLHATDGRAITPTLNRTDLGKPSDDDPFASALTPPQDAFKAPTVQKAVIKKPFNLNADDGGQFQGQQQNPMTSPENIPLDGIGDDPVAELPRQPMTPQATFNPNDPDSSPEMQLAWDAWHKRVAGTIFERFNFFARAAFRHSPPLIAEASYVVSRDGRIGNLAMRQKSSNVLFNVVIFQCIKSLDGDVALLQFPQGSRRMFVQKAGSFTQNYGGGEGFRYTTGDTERVKQ